MVGAFIPGEVAERGGDAVQLALIMLAPLLALLLIAYPAHRLVQTHGALHVMRRGLVLGAALPFLNAYIGDQLHGVAFSAWFVASRLLDGVAQGLVEVSGLSMLLRRAHGCERVTLSLGLVECVRSLATVLGPIVGGIAYQTGLGGDMPTREPKWYAVSGFWGPFLLAGLSSTAAALLASYCLDVEGLGEDSESHAARRVGDAKVLVRMPVLWLMATLHALSFATIGFLEATFASYVLAAPFGASLTWVGTHMTLGSLGLAAAALATAGIAHQFGAGMLAQVVVGEWMQAIALLALALCVSPADAALGYTLACCGVGLALVNSASLVCRLVTTFDKDPRHYAEALAALYVANYAVGYGGASQLGEYLRGEIGFRASALGLAALALVTPLALTVLRPACLARTLADGRALFDEVLRDVEGDVVARGEASVTAFGRRGTIRLVWGVWRQHARPRMPVAKKGAPASVA